MEAERERLLKKIERLRKDLEKLINIEEVGINSVLSDKARKKLNDAKEEYNNLTLKFPEEFAAIAAAEKAAAEKAAAEEAAAEEAAAGAGTAGGRRRKSRKSRKSRKTRRRRT